MKIRELFSQLGVHSFKETRTYRGYNQQLMKYTVNLIHFKNRASRCLLSALDTEAISYLIIPNEIVLCYMSVRDKEPLACRITKHKSSENCTVDHMSFQSAAGFIEYIAKKKQHYEYNEEMVKKCEAKLAARNI